MLRRLSMGAPDIRTLLVEGPRAAVRRVGERLGAVVTAGDVIALVGELGAGKTFLAQTLVHAAGVSNGTRVASPTFTVMQRYDGRIPVYHADLYRLGSLAELDEIGLFAQSVDGVAVVEWADRLVEAIPVDALWIHLDRVAPLRRRLTAWSTTARGQRLLDAARVR